MIQKLLRSERAIVLPMAVILFMIIFWLALVVSTVALNGVKTARELTYSSRARLAIDTSFELAIQNINSGAFTDIGETDLYTDPQNRFKVSYEADIEDSDPPLNVVQKEVTGIGRVYVPASSATPLVTRKAKVYLLVDSLPFSHTMQTGGGPMFLYGNSGIDATGSSIYSNDFIYMQDNASDLAGEIYVAGWRSDGVGYNGCPLSRSGQTINSNIHISSNAAVQLPNDCGVGTTASTVVQDDPPILALPNLPAGEMEEITSNYGMPCTLSGVGIITIPSKHFPNNDEPGMTNGCNVALAANKTYQLSGNVHIRGNLTGERNTITTGTTFGSQPIYIIVEGKISLDRVVVAGTAPVVFVSYSNCDAQYIDCDAANGLEPDLSDVKNHPDAIYITGNNLNMNAYFMAPNGSIEFSGSIVSGGLGALAAQSIIMNGSGTNTFANTYPDLGGVGTWRVHKYQRIFD